MLWQRTGLLLVVLRRLTEREMRAEPMAGISLGKLIPILCLGHTGWTLLLHRGLLVLYRRLLAVRSLISLRCNLFVYRQNRRGLF